MLDQETLFALGDIASSLKEIIPLLKDQKQMPRKRGGRTISRTELEQFLREYYGYDADICFSRGGYTIDVYPRHG